VEIATVAFDDPRLSELLEERHRDLATRYASVVDHPDDPTDPREFGPPSGLSLLATLDDVPAACGSLRALGDAVAEVKRMFVADRFRRRGIGAALLDALEAEAWRIGYRVVRLETGTLQPEAMAFYERAGYRRIDCYQQWTGYELSVCYEKRLTSA
jgi:putative acetyltransferase